MRDLNNYCGIDIGCTNIKMMAIVNNEQITKIIPSDSILNRKQLVSVISDFCNSFNRKLNGVGIAFSGMSSDFMKVDSTTVECLAEGLSILDFDNLGCPVRLINDSNATTLAGIIEYPQSKVLIGITNGTGIGCGVAIEGKLFTGSQGILGEIYGNPVLVEDNNITKIGKICSGSKIVKRLDKVESTEEASMIIQQASIYLGTLLTSIIHLYNPDVLYFSGKGFSNERLLEDAIQFCKTHAYPHFIQNLIFAKTSYEDYSGCIGAMKLVEQETKRKNPSA